VSTLSSYFQTTPPPYGNTVYGNPIYNASGRGYPDVAALGQNIFLYSNGEPSFVGGTSASAPIFSSIITLINEKRLAAGKSTVGFLNPTLYQNPDAFNDVRFPPYRIPALWRTSLIRYRSPQGATQDVEQMVSPPSRAGIR
jgi:tripeptidyl-peptidase-1